MSTEENAIAALVETRRESRRAVAEIQARKKVAFETNDYDEFERCAAALPGALNAEHLATQRVIAGVINPTEDGVLTLKAATAELKERIDAFAEDARKLGDLASILSIVTNAILLIGLL